MGNISEARYKAIKAIKGIKELSTFTAYSEQRYDLVNNEGLLFANKSIKPFITVYTEFNH
jgi:hypothetical protein